MKIRTKTSVFKLGYNDNIRAEFERLQVIEGDVFQYDYGTNYQEVEDELEGSIYEVEYIKDNEDRSKAKTQYERENEGTIDASLLVKVVKVDDRYNEILRRVKNCLLSLEGDFEEAKQERNYQAMAIVTSKHEFIKERILG